MGQSVDSYLQQHPDIKQELAERGQQESPGSPNPVLDYLNRHPDVRQALITLSQQCTS
ncbi:MAG: heme-binding protein [Mycobacterium sp.]